MVQKQSAPTARATSAVPEEKAFRWRDGRVSRDLPSFRADLQGADDATVEFHRNHFHFWLGEVLGEPVLAKQAESLGASARASAEALRHDLLSSIDNRLVEQGRGAAGRRR